MPPFIVSLSKMIYIQSEWKGGVLMDAEKGNPSQIKSSYVIYVFIGASVGAVLGLVAYVKDWI